MQAAVTRNGQLVVDRFSLGYSPAEYAATLDRIARRSLDPHRLITGTVGLDGVAGAFDALREPDAHVKIIVKPQGVT